MIEVVDEDILNDVQKYIIKPQMEYTELVKKQKTEIIK